MTDYEKLDSWYDNISRVNEIIIPGIRREQCLSELCDVLECAGIQVREESELLAVAA